jgi:hypothetical protein
VIRESEQGAYLGLKAEKKPDLRVVCNDPNFDVIDHHRQRLILGKCSRLADDEEPARGRYGIDFHRALPAFQGTSPFSCDWGEGPIEVNAYTYAHHLPKALKFREFTANIAFAALEPDEYQAKRQVYENFYRHLYAPGPQVTIGVPHCGQVRRPPDEFHPYPQSEIDAWTARVAVRCQVTPPAGRRLLVSLHSTDYFGLLLDIGDFGLPQNHGLSRAVRRLQDRFAGELAAILAAYRDHILPYTKIRLTWMANKWGSLRPEQLSSCSTAARFEVVNLDRLTKDLVEPGKRFTLEGLLEGLEKYWDKPAQHFITLNGVFSGRKTAQLLGLAENLHQRGFATAVQVELSRFFAKNYPDLAAAMLETLCQEL